MRCFHSALYLAIAIFLGSCTGESYTPPRYSAKDFSGKVYADGDLMHFSGCDYMFECDCCSGKYVFVNDSVFYSVAFCVSDLDVSRGKYVVKNDRITFSFGEECISRNYNWEREMDSTAVEYFFSDTIILGREYTYEIEECEGKLMLKQYRGRDWAGLSEEKASDILLDLETMGVLDHFQDRKSISRYDRGRRYVRENCNSCHHYSLRLTGPPFSEMEELSNAEILKTLSDSLHGRFALEIDSATVSDILFYFKKGEWEGGCM